MKVLYYSDIHFRERSSFLPWNKQEGRFTKELTRILNSVIWVGEVIEREKPDLVLCLGDIFHNLQTIPSSVLDVSGMAFSYLKSVCKKLGIEHWLIPGNHDYYGRYGKAIYSIRVLEGFFDRIFYEPEYSEGILFLPYFTDETRAYEEILLSSPKKIITHLTFSGASVGKVKLSGLTLPREVKAISGHIHIPQETKKFIYVGSLVQLSYNEGTRHGVYIEEGGKFRFIQNPVGKVIVKIKDLRDIEKYDIDNTGFIYETTTENLKEDLPKVDIQVKVIEEKSEDIEVEYDDFSTISPVEILENEIKEVYPSKIDYLRQLLKEE